MSFYQVSPLFYIHRVSSAFAHSDGMVTFSFSNGCALWSRNKINRGTRGEHGRSSPSNPENRYIRSVTRSAVLLALCHSESRCQRSQTSRSDQRCARSRVRFSSWYDGPLACRQELWSSASFTPDHMAEGCSVPDHRERDAGSPRCSRVPLESQLAMVSSQEAWEVQERSPPSGAMANLSDVKQGYSCTSTSWQLASRRASRCNNLLGLQTRHTSLQPPLPETR